MTKKPEDLFDDGPLDNTRLAADIARTVPGVNARARYEDWRADLKERIKIRMAARREREEHDDR